MNNLITFLHDIYNQAQKKEEKLKEKNKIMFDKGENLISLATCGVCFNQRPIKRVVADQLKVTNSAENQEEN